jgi:hypothetical protein
MKAASESVVLIEGEALSVLDEVWIDRDLKRHRARESAI